MFKGDASGSSLIADDSALLRDRAACLVGSSAGISRTDTLAASQRTAAVHCHAKTVTAPVHVFPWRQTGDSAPVAPLKTLCSSCHLRDLCLPGGITGSEIQHLDALSFGRRKIKTAQTLYRQGDRFKFIYAVRSGTFKSILTLADGREQVSGFYIAGEAMGLDGAADGVHASSAIALEDAEVCVISYALLTDLTVGNAGMQHVVFRLMSSEIVREHSLMLLLGSMNAEKRLATFVLNLSQRLKARGYSASEFHLRMSRAEIGSYLGMTLETVSRAFSSFQQQRLLEVDKRYIRVVDLDGLTRVLGTHLH